MKKVLGFLLLVSLLVLGACGEKDLTFGNPTITEYDAELIFNKPQGVNNGTVSEGVFDALMLVNISHNVYLDSLSEYDLNNEKIGEDKAEMVNEVTDLLQSKVLNKEFVEFTEADEEVSKVLYPYMVALVKEADNTGRFVLHRDEINLEQAIEHREEALKYAKKLDELVEKYNLNK